MIQLKIESIELLSSRIGFKIINQRELINGTQLSLNQNGKLLHLTIYKNGSYLVQGIESNFKELIEKWANKNLHDVIGLYPDYNMSWKEWHYEIEPLVEYINKFGEPTEEIAPHKYKINREVLFHDYMFRNSSFQNISMEKISIVLKSWSRRFCFMNIEIDKVIENVRNSIIGHYFDVTEDSIPFSVAVTAISQCFSTACHEKFIKIGNCHLCPQVKTESHFCISDIIDSLYVYCDNQEIIAYTKSNFRNLLKRNTQALTWHKLHSTSPLEELMGKGLLDAGLLSVPQYQAYNPEHKYRIDHVIKTSQGLSIAVECDGLQYHANGTTYMRDRIRDRYLQQRGFYIMRFSSIEIFNNLDECIDEIDKAFWTIQKGKLSLKTEQRLRYFGMIEDE